jgi:hypothetical protein
LCSKESPQTRVEVPLVRRPGVSDSEGYGRTIIDRKGDEAIDARLLLSRLADAGARRVAARWLLALCAAGFGLSVAVLGGLGYGFDRWIFVLLVWVVLVFIPLRMFIESSEALSAGARKRLTAKIGADPDRYDKAAYRPVIVRDLAEKYVTMPRITKPYHFHSAAAASEGLLARVSTSRDPRAAMASAIRRLLGLVGPDASALGAAAAAGEKSESIQARWDAARSLGSLTAVVTILVAAHVDRWADAPAVPELEGRDLRAYLAAAADYCDEAALEVDALPWTEPPLIPSLPPEQLAMLRDTWAAFLAAGLPAPRALTAFVDAVLPRPA